jgi:hypothetical protein
MAASIVHRPSSAGNAIFASRISRFLARRSVIVASASAPFSPDPLGPRADALADALHRDRRQVARVHLPASDRPEDADHQRAAIQALDVSGSCATLLCLGDLAFLLSHPNKRVWLADASPPLGPRELAALRSATRLFTVTAALVTALGRDYGLDATVLDPETGPDEAARRLTA